MERQEILNKLNDIFREVFDNETIRISDATTTSDIEGWDSMMHITLIAEIEDKFNIHFTMEDITSMKNVGEMITKIMELA